MTLRDRGKEYILIPPLAATTTVPNMMPQEIDSFCATDEQGGLHAVQVMQLFRLVAGRGVSDESGRWTKTDRLRFVVDEEYEFGRIRRNRRSFRFRVSGGWCGWKCRTARTGRRDGRRIHS
jgi:hypothetical protein